MLEAEIGARNDQANASHKYGLDNQKEWWTRTQRIRTVAQIPLEVALIDTGAAPIYQRIESKASHLQQAWLELFSDCQEAVTDRTVVKAIAWLDRLR